MYNDRKRERGGEGDVIIMSFIILSIIISREKCKVN